MTLQMYTFTRTRVYGSASVCKQCRTRTKVRPICRTVSAMVTVFLAGLHRRFLPHSTRARRWHLRKQFFLSWPECHICPDFLYLLFLFAFALPPSLPSLDSCSTFYPARLLPFSLSRFPFPFFFLFLFFSPPFPTFYLIFSLLQHHPVYPVEIL